MTIYLDTNILIDILVGPERENYGYSTRVLNTIAKNDGLKGIISVQTLTDIAYILTKGGEEGRQKFYTQAEKLLKILALTTIQPEEATKALEDSPRDFEDHEQILCAEKNACAYFITGDKKLLTEYNEKGGIPAIEPGLFLQIIRKPAGQATTTK